MIEVRRKEKESPSLLLRRFVRQTQQSGILTRAKKIRFYSKQKSKMMQRKAALRKDELRKHYAKLKKLGKLKS